jgi:hypothetical protein
MSFPSFKLYSFEGSVLACLCFGIFATSSAAAQVVINEYTSSNVDELRDELGETPDWIELHNPGATAVDLTGWGLSDDPLNPQRWVFPPSQILPGQYLLVYASGEDRRAFINERITVSTIGNAWRYLEPTSEPTTNWRLPNFDDSAWLEGPAGFGRGDGDEETVLQADTIFLRKSFDLNQTTIDSLVTLNFHLDYDDGFALFLNGVELDRKNLDFRFSLTRFDEFASASHEARLYRQMPISGIRLDNPSDYLVAGKNTVAIQVHNESSTSPDLSMIPFITIGRYSANPHNSVAPGLVFSDPELHTNFRLAAAGDDILLSKADGTLVEHVQTGRMYNNISRGRHPQGLAGQYYFAISTPGGENSVLAETSYAEPVSVSPVGGLFPGPATISMSHPSPSAEIRYTLDGSVPSDQSALYLGSFVVPGPVGVVRARAFEAGKWPSWPTSDTYLDRVSSPLAIYSLVTDPPHLWDYYTGIYALGPNAQPFWPYRGANFYNPWERPVHVELFEPDGRVPLKFDGGIMIHGGASRSFDQKSFRILARGGYGTERQEYRQFVERGYDSMKRIVLRNGGTDWGHAILRDGFANRVVSNLDLESSNFRPAIVLLNGEYWGIQNLRERQDKYYLEDRYDIDPHNIDLLELNSKVVEGDADHYEEMLQFLRENPMSNSANYAQLQTMMDTGNFALYYASEIFFANPDWPQYNIKYWRPRTVDGRWRWIFFDLDNGLGRSAGYGRNTLQKVVTGGGWDTFLLRSLLDNAEFKQDFCNSYADLMNTAFLPARTIPILNQMASEMDPEVDRHFSRWIGTRAKWEAEVAEVETFMNLRPLYARAHVVNEFGFNGQYTLDLDVQSEGAGYLKLTAVDVSDSFTGIYFLGNPCTITAVAAPGYSFDSWSDPLLPNNNSVSIDPIADYALTGNFIQVGDSVVINEINYKSSAAFDPGDWVELSNNSDSQLDISGWLLADFGNGFTIPQGTTIPARGYLVLCNDLAAFQTLFPNVSNAIGDLDFGFSGSGERIQLYDASLSLIDEVEYNNQPAWPIPPTGLGPTLELYQPGLDNANPRNWRSSIAAHGTPGVENSVRP